MENLQTINMLVHVVVGSVGLAGGVLALATAKGSRRHVLGGTIFVWTSLVVVVTSLLSMFHEFFPLAVMLSLAVVYLVPSAMLSVNRQFRHFRVANVLLMGLVALLFAFSIIQFVRFNLLAGQLLIGPLVLAAVFGSLFAQDWHMMRRAPVWPNYWIRRHLVRMILAFTIAVMALVRIGINLGLSLEASVVLPLAVAAACIMWTYRRYPVPAERGAGEEMEQA